MARFPCHTFFFPLRFFTIIIVLSAICNEFKGSPKKAVIKRLLIAEFSNFTIYNRGRMGIIDKNAAIQQKKQGRLTWKGSPALQLFNTPGLLS